jgi:hypothetical protein
MSDQANQKRCRFCRHVKGTKAPVIRTEDHQDYTEQIFCSCSCHRG